VEEADLYEEELAKAKEHLLRWKSLGRQLEKIGDPWWESVLATRQTDVKQLEVWIEWVRRQGEDPMGLSKIIPIGYHAGQIRAINPG
jgi:hypothetical protein